MIICEKRSENIYKTKIIFSASRFILTHKINLQSKLYSYSTPLRRVVRKKDLMLLGGISLNKISTKRTMQISVEMRRVARRETFQRRGYLFGLSLRIPPPLVRLNRCHISAVAQRAKLCCPESSMKLTPLCIRLIVRIAVAICEHKAPVATGLCDFPCELRSSSCLASRLHNFRFRGALPTSRRRIMHPHRPRRRFLSYISLFLSSAPSS